MRQAVDDAVNSIETRLRALADPKRAEGERAYLKSDLIDDDRVHLGVATPACRRIVRQELRALGAVTHDELLYMVGSLWDRPEFEFKRAATEMAHIRSEMFTPDDLDQVLTWMRRAQTWALIDEWAPRVVGRLLDNYPSEVGPVLDRWSVDDDFWIRRSSLLSMLISLRRGEGEFDRFGRYADAMMGETEFFIRKAIGWTLRDMSRRRPIEVAEFIRPRVGAMSGLTFREAVRRLPDELRIPLVVERAKIGKRPNK